MSNTDDLMKLKELLDSGLLTKKEFESEKKKILRGNFKNQKPVKSKKNLLKGDTVKKDKRKVKISGKDEINSHINRVPKVENSQNEIIPGVPNLDNSDKKNKKETTPFYYDAEVDSDVPPILFKNKSSSAKIFTAIFIVIFLGCIFFLAKDYLDNNTIETSVESSASSENTENDDNSRYITYAQEIIGEYLLVPSSASFPSDMGDYTITSNKLAGTNKVEIESYVEAENAFGTSFKDNFLIKLEYTGDSDKYTVTYVKIGDKVHVGE